MPPTNTSLSRVRVATTSGGVYTLVGYTRSFGFSEGTDGGGVTRYFGGEIRHPGDPTASGTLALLYDPGDANGQEILKAAKRGGTTVFLQICPAGTATGAKCEQIECYVTEMGLESDREGGQYVERSISYEGIPSTLTTVTLA